MKIIRPSAVLTSPSPSTGVFAQFASTDEVISAVNTYGWPGIAMTEGSSISGSPYTQPVIPGGTSENATEIIEAAYAKASFWWLSEWEVAGGPELTVKSYKAAAHTAAFKVAGPTVMAAANKGGYLPEFIVLDPEGVRAPTSSQKSLAQAMIDGWTAGLTAYSSELTYLGAWYIPGEVFFSDWDANSMGVPLLQGTTFPPEITLPTGSNIQGYQAAYGSCANAPQDVKTVDGWGGGSNTLQFSSDQYTCYHNSN